MTVIIDSVFVDGRVVYSSPDVVDTAWLELGTWKDDTRIYNNVRVVGRAQAIYSGDLKVSVYVGGYCGNGTDICGVDPVNCPSLVEYVINSVEAGKWYEFDISTDIYVKGSDPNWLTNVVGNIGNGVNVHVSWYSQFQKYLVGIGESLFASGYSSTGMIKVTSPEADCPLDICMYVDGQEVDKIRIPEGVHEDVMFIGKPGDFELRVCWRSYSGCRFLFRDIQLVEENPVTGSLDITAKNGHSDETDNVSIPSRGYFDEWFGGIIYAEIVDWWINGVNKPSKIIVDDLTQRLEIRLLMKNVKKLTVDGSIIFSVDTPYPELDYTFYLAPLTERTLNICVE